MSKNIHHEIHGDFSSSLLPTSSPTPMTREEHWKPETLQEKINMSIL